MANKAISELPQAQNVNNQDLFVLEQSGIAKKLTAETFITEQGIIDALAEALDGHGGIQSVTLSSVSGRIRTYRITFTDQSATTFQVYDGTSIDRISRTSSSGLDDVYTIFLSDGTTTFFTVHNGADGNVSEAMLNDALKDKAPAITETTESSAIANFTDGADDMPLHNILAEITPVQDLNGYDNPWPAGGGKNKLKITATTTTINGITYTVNVDGTIVANGTASGVSTIVLTSGTGLFNFDSEMILNGSVSGFGDNIKIRFGLTNPAIAYDDFGNGVTIPQISDISTRYAYVQLTILSGTTVSNIVFKPMIRLATETDATFAPYSNICPITGHTEVNVTRTGKNVLATIPENTGSVITSIDAQTGVVSVADISTAQWVTKPFAYSDVKAGQIYTFSASLSYGRIGGSISATGYPTVNNDPSTSIGQNIEALLTKTVAVKTFTANKTERIYWYYCTDNGISGHVAFSFTPQLELGSTATAFEPYITPSTVSLSWQTEAGTVYGGMIDVATGLLTVDRAMVDLGTLAWGYESSTAQFYSNGIAETSINWNNWSDTPPLLCSRYKPISNALVASSDFCVGYAYNSKQLRVKDSGFTDAATFKTAMSGVQLVYELATPQTYQLTPQEVLHTLYGVNNVWADTGNTTVTYPADTKLYIEKLTQPTEDDLVANQAITSGKYFMIGNSLYLALANIASGAQITIGTNAQRVSLADALNTINS